MPARQRPRRRLAPGQIAEELFCIDPDRDERAPQLCAETLLTLAQNGYNAPIAADQMRSPKVQRFAVRSLALEENFLSGRDTGRSGDDTTTPADYGSILARGGRIRDSANLQLAQDTMQGLVDPETQVGQKGTWLLRPFHESLLWYDARRPGPNSLEYSVRKVKMRGSGITLARLLTSPPNPNDAILGERAVIAIQEALTLGSPLADISTRLEAALPPGEIYTRPPGLEQDEQDAWEKGRDPRLADLASRICRHAEGVMRQGGASGPAKLWQLRTILALDLAMHVLHTAWSVTRAPIEERYLLLSLGEGPRGSWDPVWQRSQDTYRRTRIRLSEATVLTLARRMRELGGEVTDWASEFEPRSGLSNADDTSVSSQLAHLRHPADPEAYLRLARIAVENANYGRAEEGFRVLLESVGLLAGTRYRYLTAPPELFAALVGALSAEMPMASRNFFTAVRKEWGFVINQESAAETTLTSQLDGAGLERNARHAERLLSDSGLAVGLSDRTTMVGERAARSTP